MIGITERGDASLDLGWKEWVVDGKPAILITKNPQMLYNHLLNICNSGTIPNIIVHCTITGLGRKLSEPKVPPWKQAIRGYNAIINKIGPERVVLRIDPIYPHSSGCACYVLDIANSRVFGTRLRVSFMDAYPHVRERYVKSGFCHNDIFNWEGIHAPLERRLRCLQQLPPDTEVCGEPGIPCTGCVSLKDCVTFGITTNSGESSKQRPACRCLTLKHELLKNKGQCAHKCLYCYWH